MPAGAVVSVPLPAARVRVVPLPGAIVVALPADALLDPLALPLLAGFPSVPASSTPLPLPLDIAVVTRPWGIDSL